MNHLHQLFSSVALKELTDIIRNMGTHSLRNVAVTMARMCGCSKDDVDVRGRWKLASRQQDTYMSITIPHMDRKVDVALCHD